MTEETTLTGFEPRLGTGRRARGYRRLLPRQLGALLGTLTPESITPDAAAALLHSDQFYARYHAARLLGERGDRNARLIMQEALETGSAPTRASVARHLHRFSWFSVEPLLRRALDDPEEAVREAAVYALCDLREPGAYHLLDERLPQDTDLVRAAAAWGLRNCQDTAAVPALVAALAASDPEVRIRALEALSANNSREAVPPVRAALDDPQGEVVYNAVLSLLELRGERALPEIVERIRLLRDDPRLKDVLRGLFHAVNYLHLDVENDPALDPLLDVLADTFQNERAAVRMAVGWLLAGLRDARAGQLLLEGFARERSSAVQAHLVRIAVSLMAEVSADLLQAALDSPDPDVCGAAQELYELQALGALAAYDAADAAVKPLSKIELVGRR